LINQTPSLKAIVALSAKGKSTTEKMVSNAGKTLKLLKSSEVHRLAYLFRNAHTIAKQNRPYSDILRNRSLFVSKGLDQSKHLLSNHESFVPNHVGPLSSDFFLQMTMCQKIRF
jgi:hypothetical protein